MEAFLRQIEEIVELPQGSATPSDRFREYETWDSLTFLVLLSQINEEYGITISNGELRGIQTLEELWGLIQGRI